MWSNILVFVNFVNTICSDDVEKLKKLILHNPYILTLPEAGDSKDELVPKKNVQQFWVRLITFDIVPVIPSLHVTHFCTT